MAATEAPVHPDHEAEVVEAAPAETLTSVHEAETAVDALAGMEASTHEAVAESAGTETSTQELEASSADGVCTGTGTMV